MKKNIFSQKELSQIYLYLSRSDLPVKYVYKTKKGADAWVKWENLKKKRKIYSN